MCLLNFRKNAAPEFSLSSLESGEATGLLESDDPHSATAHSEKQKRELYRKAFLGEGWLPRAMQLMKIVFEDSNTAHTTDVFVHYHWADRAWVCDVLQPRLQVLPTLY